MRKSLIICMAAVLCLATTAAQAEALKVGIIEPFSGAQTTTGRMFSTAVHYVLENVNENGGFNGQPIQIIEYDNAGNSAQAAVMFRKAAADGVDIVVQGTSSAIGAVIASSVRKYDIRHQPADEILYINVGAQAMKLRGRLCQFHAFHFAPTAPMLIGPLVKVMSEQGDLGNRVFSINQNYTWGRDVQEAIVKNADKYGYKVVGKVLHAVNRIHDFAPYVAKIASANATSVITGNWSNDLLLLMKAIGNAGLNIPLGAVFLNQPGNIGNAGKVALGDYLASTSNLELLDQKLVRDYKATTGHYPVYVEPETINAMRFLAKALKKVDFNGGEIVVNKIAFALENTSLETELGTITMRKADHQAAIPIVVSRVSKDAEYPVDGTNMGFKPIDVVPGEKAIFPVQDSCNMRRPS